jgi:hypothetical protein
MSRRYLVELPTTEGMRLAGIRMGWPSSPEGRCVHAISQWLTGLERRRVRCVLVTKISRDLWPLLERVSLAERPLHGPFAHSGGPLPGQVEYLGAGTVRLDDTALNSLAELRPGEDFRITYEATGPVLAVGHDRYPAREEPGPAA